MTTKEVYTTGIHFDSRAKFTATAIILPDSITIEQCIEAAQWLSAMNEASQFWIGDLLEHTERKFGETYAQLETYFKINVERLRNYKWVSSRVNVSVRNDKLTWSHHYEIAKLEPKEQKRWLDSAEKHAWDVRELKAALESKGLRKAKKTKEIAAPVETPVDIASSQYGESFLALHPVAHNNGHVQEAAEQVFTVFVDGISKEHCAGVDALLLFVRSAVENNAEVVSIKRGRI